MKQLFSDCGTTLDMLTAVADEVIKSNPKLTYKDFEVDLDYGNCYYEGDTPYIRLEWTNRG